MRQYQEIASPPPQLAPAAPTFFAAYYPDRLDRKYPEHPQAFAPPHFETLPAPTMGAAYYPDRLYRFYPDHPQPATPPPFQTLPSPDLAARAFYPDRLERQRGLWPMPFRAEQNLDPISNPVPDLSWKPTYPDRLERQRGLWPMPFQSEQNLDPIADPFIPDFFSANYPSKLLGHPPPRPPTIFQTPAPQDFLALDDASRGLHVGDIRGFYHTLRSAACEPYSSYTTTNAQVIPDSAYTVLTIAAVTSHGGFATRNLDAWNMVDMVNSRILFKHDGYYIVSVMGEWDNNATGQRRVRVRLFNTITLQRVILEDIRNASFITSIAVASDIQPVAKGWWLQTDVFQSSGGDLPTGNFHISVHRIATPTRVVPI